MQNNVEKILEQNRDIHLANAFNMMKEMEGSLSMIWHVWERSNAAGAENESLILRDNLELVLFALAAKRAAKKLNSVSSDLMAAHSLQNALDFIEAEKKKK